MAQGINFIHYRDYAIESTGSVHIGSALGLIMQTVIKTSGAQPVYPNVNLRLHYPLHERRHFVLRY